MTLTLGQPVLFFVTAVLVAGALTWWLYRETTPELSVGRRVMLAGLRVTTLLVIVFLLAEPLFSDKRSVLERPVLGVLFDESQSMTLVDADTSNGRPLYDDLIGRVRSASSDERAELFGFGSSGRRLVTFDSLNTLAARTNISSGLEFVEETLQDEPLGAVLLISDGRHIEGRNPEHIAEEYPVPIISIIVGDTTVQRDVRIQQVLSNDLSYVGREVPVRVRVRNEGYSDRGLSVRLLQNGVMLDEKTEELPASGSEIVRELAFVPAVAGFFQYRVEISQFDGELTYRNNTELFSLQILERERTVLLISGAPSPDAAAMSRMLVENADTRLTVRTQKSPGVYFEGRLSFEDIESPSGSVPDLIILVGYPTRETSAADIQRLSGALTEGSSLLYIIDRGGDLSVAQRDLGAFLAARPQIIRPDFVAGDFSPTPQALQHAIFDITDRRETLSWSTLPPVALTQTTWDVAPGATILASAVIRGISIDDPVLVVQRSPASRSAALLASGFWRWRNVPEDLESASTRWTELFSNLVQWLVTEEDDRRVRVSPGRGILDESQSVIFSGQVYDENLSPLSDAAVAITVDAPSGEQFPYEMQPLGNGQYRADLGTLAEGVYSYTANATRDGGALGSDQGTFSVGAVSVEFRTPYADPTTMRQIARRSGGFVIPQSELATLPDRLSELSTYKSREIETKTQYRLWRWLPLLVVLLGLLTTEWFLRKRYGLV